MAIKQTGKKNLQNNARQTQRYGFVGKEMN